jgi:NAD(P)-dependent dehydrogenase (short-subunit alcohol dehydrogenase family)
LESRAELRKGEVVVAQKVVLVTGGSAGIGWATSVKLQGAGWHVVSASRRGIAASGCQGLVMDVDDDASVRAGVAQVLSSHGQLDAVITCAGWGMAGAVELTPLTDAKGQFETNFWGTVRVVQAALPAMRSQGRGRVVLLGSIAGAIGLPFQAFYSASKFALEGFGEALAYEVSPFGVTVTIVEPGNVATEFTDRRKVAGEGPCPAYPCPAYPAQAKAIAKMEHDERNGVSPEQVADLLLKVLSSQRPPRRASVGKASERIGLLAKRVMPYALFEAAARSSLGV